ncbi:MAG: acyl-CoA thioesterase, partial [Actinomycetota bacterium]|nr:acyl-CoA thioesterase [Actinomycetota bacterium]
EKAWALLSRSARPSSRGVRTAEGGEARLIHETKLRVRYSETDAQGIVNNANYLSYFEVGRVDWLRAIGLSYKELERQGYGFVVAEVRAFYKKPAFFDDELTLFTELIESKRASFSFGYRLLRNGEVVATGSTRHACVELATGKPLRVPKELGARVFGGQP